MTILEQLAFKNTYLEELSIRPKKILLTPFEAENKDHWALKVFGDPKYAYLFDMLIPNIDYAIKYAYEVIDG